MKIDFKDVKVPIDPATLPPPKLTVFKGRELEEIHERMRSWLSKTGDLVQQKEVRT